MACMAFLSAYQLGWLGVENITFVGYFGAGAMLAGVGLVVVYAKQIGSAATVELHDATGGERDD